MGRGEVGLGLTHAACLCAHRDRFLTHVTARVFSHWRLQARAAPFCIFALVEVFPVIAGHAGFPTCPPNLQGQGTNRTLMSLVGV
jgi:hypothetical protein